jgi:hypothetical protein
MSKEEQEAERILKIHSVTYLCDWTIEYEIDILATKRHAIIHVEGIIKELKRLIGFYEDNGMVDSDLSCQPVAYWQEVLTILNNK